MLNKQTQSAGDNSTQQQANTIINVGIDEKRAREIYREMNLQLKREYTQEALAVAKERVEMFENKLLPKMEAVDGALEAFADPGFQLLLQEAQKRSAATERPADYDLLSELLLQRFLRGENRVIRAGISRAVEIVDEISDDALLGLTVLHSVASFAPNSGRISGGLETLNNLFGKLLNSALPLGKEWLEHLDILDAIRVNNFGVLPRLEEIYQHKTPGYFAVGIEKDSSNYFSAIKLLQDSGLATHLLIQHELIEQYVRLDIARKELIDEITFSGLGFDGAKVVPIRVKMTESQKEAINQIYELYDNVPELADEIKRKFREEWDKYENLKVIGDWWNTLNVACNITAVGKVLAHSNAQRCDSSLPPLN